MDYSKSKIKNHPAANIFPMMADAQFAALKTDIHANGQRDEIVLFDGKILDGRNRYKACIELSIEPDVCDLEDCDDPVGYVLSKNLHRRELKTSQKAICAATMAGLPNGVKQAVSNDTASADKAATIFGVGRATVFRALTVMREGCKSLVEMCEQGIVNVTLAGKFIEAVPDKREQAKIVAKGKAAILDVVNKPPDPPCLLTCIERLHDAVSGLLNPS